MEFEVSAGLNHPVVGNEAEGGAPQATPRHSIQPVGLEVHLFALLARLLAKDPVSDLATILEAQREKGVIPRKVSQSLLKDLLELRRCVCGTEFEDGDSIYQTLESRLITEQQRSSDQALLELLYQLRSTSDLVNSAARDLANKDEDASRYEDIRRGLDLAINEVDAELDKMPQENVAQLRSDLEERRDGLQNVTRKQ